jgi:hypothetical protein
MGCLHTHTIHEVTHYSHGPEFDAFLSININHRLVLDVLTFDLMPEEGDVLSHRQIDHNTVIVQLFLIKQELPNVTSTLWPKTLISHWKSMKRSEAKMKSMERGNMDIPSDRHFILTATVSRSLLRVQADDEECRVTHMSSHSDGKVNGEGHEWNSLTHRQDMDDSVSRITCRALQFKM